MKTTEKADLIERPPVVEKTAVVISLPGCVAAVADSATGFSLDPFLAIAVLRIFDILACVKQCVAIEAPVNISRMGHIVPGDDSHQTVVLSRGLLLTVQTSAALRWFGRKLLKPPLLDLKQNFV